MTIKDFAYTINSPFFWGLIMLLALRAIYKCAMEKDWPHLAAFICIAGGAGYMLAAGMGILALPEAFK